MDRWLAPFAACCLGVYTQIICTSHTSLYNIRLPINQKMDIRLYCIKLVNNATPIAYCTNAAVSNYVVTLSTICEKLILASVRFFFLIC